ncbi:MAG: UDP-N-acetylmuramoyl-L-alanyl-D-glutamate--2,6-diaminopimelate ligase [Cycloclasticus sp.]|nr:MAG: UDP-N-acetylmuramoyl-L-alanyl-D-glutamate--2,6-diaminopimelate ligase [Cycloclasticus sp.]
MMPAQLESQTVALKILLDDFVQLDEDVYVTEPTVDAREVMQNGLFLAVSGSHSHGLSFVDQAIQNGVGAIVYDPAGGGEQLANNIAEKCSIKLIPLANLNAHISDIASRFYNQPSSQLPVIGITGTNGKTSVSHFISQAFTDDAATCGVIGTLGWGLLSNLTSTLNTTPDAASVQRQISCLLNDGVAAIAMEVSSHGLNQARVKAVEFKGAIFTNLNHDHLDYHLTLEAYGQAKLALFKSPSLEFVVLNADDVFSNEIIEVLSPTIEVFSYSRLIDSLGRSFIMSNEKQTASGLSFDVKFDGEFAHIESSLFGRFNIDNLTATMASLVAMGVSFQEAVEKIQQITSVLGRMQKVSLFPTCPTVIVDYAHTPDALKLALSSLREHCSGKLLVVFGCGGNRDAAKRPMMGAIAADMADEVIITNDNPRLENAEDIAAQITADITSSAHVETILDRTQAIQHAIRSANSDDIILVAGKGHETYQLIGDERFIFSDIACVKSALKSRVLTDTGDSGCAS